MPPSPMQPMPGSNQPLQAFMARQQEMAFHASQQDGSATPRGPAGDPAQQVLAEASKLYAQRRYEESAKLFAQLTTSRLFVDQGHYGLGIIALVQGDRAGAAAHFGNAVAANPAFANASFYLGEIAEQSGNSATALAHYRQALTGNRSHAGATRAVARLSGAAPQPPVAALPTMSVAAPTMSVPPPPVGEPLQAFPDGADRLGVYEYLRSDTTLLSRQTVAGLEAIELRRRSSVMSWLGGFILRAVLWFGLIVAVAIFRLSTNVDVNEDVLWILAAAMLASYLLRGATTEYRISGGRLTITRGILWRRTRQVELWRVQDIERRQGLVDRLTGHGELKFRAVSVPGGMVTVRGLARGKRLRQLHQQLLDLVFLLRTNPVVKGIIS